RRAAGAALPRRCGGRLPVPLRGLRDAGDRGDGLGRARRRVLAPLARRGVRRRGRSRGSRERRGDRVRRARGARPAQRAAHEWPCPRGGILLVAHRRAASPGVPAIRVAVDTTPLRQTRAGTARYLRGLLAHLDVDVEEVSFPAGSRAGSLAADALWYPRLRATGADVLHCPTFRGPFRSPTPLVVTVHDLAVLRHPEWFRGWSRRYSRLAVPRVVRAADRVIAVSDFTKRELVELLAV